MGNGQMNKARHCLQGKATKVTLTAHQPFGGKLGSGQRQQMMLLVQPHHTGPVLRKPTESPDWYDKGHHGYLQTHLEVSHKEGIPRPCVRRSGRDGWMDGQVDIQPSSRGVVEIPVAIWEWPHLPSVKHHHGYRLCILAFPAKHHIPDPAPLHTLAPPLGQHSEGWSLMENNLSPTGFFKPQ